MALFHGDLNICLYLFGPLFISGGTGDNKGSHSIDCHCCLYNVMFGVRKCQMDVP